MSFTLLFSSYLFHFFPLPCSHIFSWCLLSLAVAWVATSWKYWFLPSLLFFFFFLLPPLLQSLLFPLTHPRVASEARGLTHDHFTGSSSRFSLSLLLPLFLCCLLIYFFFSLRLGSDVTLWLLLSLKALPAMSELRVEVEGVTGWGGGWGFLSAITSLYSPLHPSKQHRPMYRHLAHSRPQPLTTHSPWQHTNNCKLSPLVRSPQSEMSF